MYCVCDGSDVTSDQAGRERGLETVADHFSAPATTLLLNVINVISKMVKHPRKKYLYI